MGNLNDYISFINIWFKYYKYIILCSIKFLSFSFYLTLSNAILPNIQQESVLIRNCFRIHPSVGILYKTMYVYLLRVYDMSYVENLVLGFHY